MANVARPVADVYHVLKWNRALMIFHWGVHGVCMLSEEWANGSLIDHEQAEASLLSK